MKDIKIQELSTLFDRGVISYKSFCKVMNIDYEKELANFAEEYKNNSKKSNQSIHPRILKILKSQGLI